MNKKINYDVIIAGAGPVGLFLACELALAKCSVLILEKSENTNSILKKIPFGLRGLNAPSIEAFDRRGLLTELEIHKSIKSPHQHSGTGARRQMGHFAGIPFHEGDIDVSTFKNRLPSSTPLTLISEMEELEKILSKRAAGLGVEIKRGFAITDFKQNEDEVSVYSDTHFFTGQWLVGCDGARSLVRKKAGFDFIGTEPEFTGYTTKLEIADPEKLKSGRNQTAHGMYLQSQPGYIVIQDFDKGLFHNSEKPITLDHVQEVLRRVSNTDVTITRLHTATTWTDRARQATLYRKGRILLAGDAAHIHSPLGGQGLNLGLGDAMNLGWKLAATIQNKAPKGLLDTYQIERHPLGEQVLDWSRAQVAIMNPNAAGRALNCIIRDLMNTQQGSTYFASRVWGVFTKNNLVGDHPLVGHSVPNFKLESEITMNELMRNGQGFLIDFTNNNLLKDLSAKTGEWKYICEAAKNNLGLAALFVRPDGMIAWACDKEPNLDELKKALNDYY